MKLGQVRQAEPADAAIVVALCFGYFRAMTLRLRLPIFAFISLAQLALAVAAFVPFMPPQPGWGLRLLVLGLWGGVLAIQLGRGRVDLLLSPLFLLAGFCVLFYSVVLSALAFVAIDAGHGPTVMPYLGSRAEGLVLGFALAATLAHAALLAVRAPAAVGTPPVRVVGAAAIGAVTALAGLSVASPGSFAFTLAQAWLPFLLALLAGLAAATRGWPARCGLGLAAILSLATFAIAGGKVTLFTPLALMVLVLVVRRPRFRQVVIYGIAAVSATVLAAGVHYTTRQSLAYNGLERPTLAATVAAAVENIVLFKVVVRQGDTGVCLLGAVDRHLDQPASGNPLFFANAVVPRILWPDKPSLSLGGHYATAYCRSSQGGADPRHSASITLLGQPVVQAGAKGLAVSTVVLLVTLLTGTALVLRGGFVGLVLVAGMLPYLCDFDQDFALYVGNAVRALLLILPLAWMAGRLLRERPA